MDKFRILMIDDEKDIGSFFAKTFAHFKHIEFLLSDRAAEGVQIAKREKPGVILLDLRMPGMNGEEALAELKQFLPNSKIIIMTGWEDGETQSRIEAMGVDAYYTKPIDMEKVITKVLSFAMVKDAGKS